MKKGIYRIDCNEKLADEVYRMKLSGDMNGAVNPGQFVNIELEGLYLRRPISISDIEPGSLILVYKVVGRGTAKMSTLKSGDKLDLLTGLGNGFDTSDCGAVPLVIGGGIGIPPLLLLTKRLISEGKHPRVILGFNTKSEIFLEREFRALDIPVHITTTDGSYGIKGYVTNAMSQVEHFDYTFSCGPEVMLKAVYDATETDGQFSFEERMGCGFGACMGCACKTKYGSKRICMEGPVLKKEEIIW